jgi:rhodanese-related sulfurtransferase
MRQGMASESSEKVEIDEARQQIAKGEATAIDVRDEDQWSQEHVINAIHLPDIESSSELEELDEGSRLIVFADSDRAASEAAEALREKGFETAIAKGGMKAWNKEGFNVQPTDDPDEDTELGRGN